MKDDGCSNAPPQYPTHCRAPPEMQWLMPHLQNTTKAKDNILALQYCPTWQYLMATIGLDTQYPELLHCRSFISSCAHLMLWALCHMCPLATVVYTLSQSVDAHCAIRHICPLHFVRMLLYKNGSVKLQRTVQCSEVLGTYDYTATVKLPTLSSVSLMCGV